MQKQTRKSLRNNKKRRIRLKMIFLSLLFLLIITGTIYYIMNKEITNIYIEGNSLLSDQEVIELAKIENYPSSMSNSSKVIKKRLEKNKYIIEAIIKKKWLTQVYIKIEENIPILYNSKKNTTILKNGMEVNQEYDVPIVVNEFPKKLYNSLIKNMAKVPYSVFRKISEIKYDPDGVDTERILLTMVDGNYTYIAMSKFELVYDYNDIIKEFGNKNGILYLNSGGYFKVLSK